MDTANSRMALRDGKTNTERREQPYGGFSFRCAVCCVLCVACCVFVSQYPVARHQILSIPYFLRYHGRDHIPLPVSRTRYYGYAVIINTLPSLYHDRARFKRDPILLFYRRDRCSDGRAFFGDFVAQFQLTNVRAGSKIKRL